MFNVGSRLQTADEFSQRDRNNGWSQQELDDAENAADPQQSRTFNKAVDQATGFLMRMMNQNNGKDSVPGYNKADATGHSGLVDPSLTDQQTTLPQMRRMEQAANFRAIINTLPPNMQQANLQIAKVVESQHPNLQKYLKQTDSIYNQGNQGFMANKMKIELQNRRLNSLYGVV